MGLEIFSLEAKSAIITGGSKGLGESMTLALAEAGAEVLITSRHWDEVSETAERIQTATGKRVLPLQSDVTNATDVEAMKHKALDEFGKIDILINNAGINIRKPLLALSDEDWHQVMNINLTGPMLCARSVGRHMVERKSGRIINLASMLGAVGLAERTPYASSKGGLIQFTRTLALEWAQYNILVNAICPGPFATSLNRPILESPEKAAPFLKEIPLKRFGEPKELKGAVIFLASDASSFVTGTTLFVDGGWTAH